MRIELDVQIQNEAVLETIAQTAQSQFRLRRTVEGLSTIAISYYLLGILSYALAGPLEGLHMEKTMALSISAPSWCDRVAAGAAGAQGACVEGFRAAAGELLRALPFVCLTTDRRSNRSLAMASIPQIKLNDGNPFPNSALGCGRCPMTR